MASLKASTIVIVSAGVTGSFTGKWKMTIYYQGKVIHIDNVNFTKFVKGGVIQGNVTGIEYNIYNHYDMSTYKGTISGAMNGDNITITRSMPAKGFTRTFQLKFIDNTTMKGTWFTNINTQGTATFTKTAS